MITKEQIDEIREKTDIVDLIGEYLPLKKVGKNYRALCPFHTEKDPSFYVNPEKKIFYCFGCQTGGDALTFVMKYENLDFPSALEKLGKRVGVNIVRGSAQDKYEDLYEANEFAANFYNLALEKDSDQRGLNYLRQRKITQDTIKRFKLGYAPPAGGLIAEARKKNFAIEKLIKIGLVSADRRWEHFRARVIFPIFNLGGRIIGFGGRGIDERIEPKYLNSPESPIFKKGDALFGLYQARDSIRARNSALLVEGYFDQISLFQAGILNVVAPLGTAFTESQALLLSRYCKQVYLFFDGDMSGIRAALRAIGLLINVQVGVKVVNLPEGKDPDSFVNEKGERGVNELIESAQDFLDFYREAKGFKNIEEEISLIKEIAQILRMINDPIRFEKYLRYTSKLFEISEDSLRKEIAGQKKDREEVGRKTVGLDPEIKIFATSISSDEKFKIAQNYLDPDDFSNKELNFVFSELKKREKIDFSSVLSLISDETMKKALMNLALFEQSIDDSEFERMIKKFKIKREIQQTRRLLGEAVRKGDDGAIKALQMRLIELKKFSL